VDRELAAPQRGEALIEQTAIGLNFIDTYQRSGLYPVSLPSGLGTEAAGIVLEVGAGVTSLSPGDRVVYTGGPLGAYCGARIYAAERLIRIPEGISDEQAAAVLLKGLTAWYLLCHSYPAKPGDTVLVHAAAGGVGLLLCQWASHIGVTTIGVVGNEDKAQLARAHGCSQTLLAGDPDIASRVREFTGGRGVQAVYDSVGKDTFIASLDSLAPHGVMVSYGNASGIPDPFSVMELAKRHSLFITRPVLFDFISTREELLMASGVLFELVANGALRIMIGQRYALADVGRAHIDIEARRTRGSTVLLP
jgi:NADPH2:quinone reductase